MPSSSMQPLSATADATGTLTSICQELRDYLQRERRLVDEQIRTYPTPIPRCDVQFNDLYERRTRLSQALQRVSGLLDQASSPEELASSISDFIGCTAYSEDPEEQRLKAWMKAEMLKLG